MTYGTRGIADRRTFLRNSLGCWALLAPGSLLRAGLADCFIVHSTRDSTPGDRLMNVHAAARPQRHLHDEMAGYVERGEVPGLVTLLRRGDQVHVDAIGTKTMEGKDRPPVQRDTIFRIASMTKAITAVATMILVEEGKLKLDDPVDDVLPELANRKVLKRPDSALDDTVLAKRAVTLRDLLTFRFGLGLLLAPPDTHPIVKAMYERKVGVTPFPAQMPLGPDQWMNALGTLPLIHQPGEGWLYHTGSDVLGVLIARVSGRPFEVFLRERIFDPLGMKDTSFSVPTNKLDRFVPCYSINPETKKVEIADPPNGQWSHPPAFPSGGGGLVSTVDDYLVFASILAKKGKANGKRIVSKSSVQVMTTNQLTPEQQEMGKLILGENHGWGFGVSVSIKPDEISSHPGHYGWNGGLGTSWFNDANEDVTAIILTQRAFESAAGPAVIHDFWKLAIAASKG